MQITKCAIHLDEGCKGSLVTRKSIYGAVQTNCEKAWNEPIDLAVGEQKNSALFLGGRRRIKIDLSGWPEILPEEMP